MDKAVIEKKLAELMDLVPECEGLIAADLEGKVLIGQTITEMDHGTIAKACASIMKNAHVIGSKIDKGNLRDISIELNDGFTVMVSSSEMIFIALAGIDGRSSLGLIKRNLMNIAK